MNKLHHDVDCVFVYGTLKRGQCRESCWPIAPLEVFDGWVLGMLWGRSDYPALVPGDNRVRGELWVYESSQLDGVLAVLDEIEGTDGNSANDLYHRYVVDVNLEAGQDSRKAYSYFYHRDPNADGFAPVSRAGSYQSWPEGPDKTMAPSRQ